MTSAKTSSEPGLPAVFDRDAALKRLGNDTALFAEMVQFFIADSPGLVAQVHEGLGKGNAKQVERAAHSLKGMAAMFDASRVVAAAGAVENLGRTGELGQAAAAVEQLGIEVENLVRAMQAHAKSD